MKTHSSWRASAGPERRHGLGSKMLRRQLPLGNRGDERISNAHNAHLLATVRPIESLLGEETGTEGGRRGMPRFDLATSFTGQALFSDPLPMNRH
jgi:hypothetical protein